MRNGFGPPDGMIHQMSQPHRRNARHLRPAGRAAMPQRGARICSGCRSAYVVASSLLVAACGCVKPPPPPPVVIPEEPEPTPLLVDRYNANADRLPENVLLTSERVEVEGGYIEDDGSEHVFQGEGKLYFVKPNKLYLILKHDLAGKMVEIGSDGTRYWLWWDKRQTVWWGYHKYIDRPVIREMPIRPDQLIAALGLTPLPSGSGWLKGPLRRTVRYPMPEYLLSFWRLDDGVPRYDREYWLSRGTPHLIDRINFFDEFGRESCEATLADLKAPRVEGNVITGPPPLMPHKVWLRWARSKAYFRMTVQRPLIKSPSARQAKGWYPMDPPANWRVVQIDEEYDRGSTTAPTSGPAAPSTSAKPAAAK